MLWGANGPPYRVNFAKVDRSHKRYWSGSALALYRIYACGATRLVKTKSMNLFSTYETDENRWMVAAVTAATPALAVGPSKKGERNTFCTFLKISSRIQFIILCFTHTSCRPVISCAAASIYANQEKEEKKTEEVCVCMC